MYNIVLFLEAVEARHHPVDDQDIETALAGRGEARFPIRRGQAVMRRLGQPLGHHFGRFEVVLDDQYPHARPFILVS